MALIKVIRGGCGIEYTDANGNARHALKTPEHGPFECDDAQAARLVKLGVAEYVGAKATEDDGDEQLAGNTPGHLDAEQLAEMDYNDLKKLAADMDVKPKGKTKADYIAAIVAESVELGDEDDDMPELNAADPE